MPLLHRLAAPGSARRSLCRNTRFSSRFGFEYRVPASKLHGIAAASLRQLQRKCPACRGLGTGAPSAQPCPTVVATSCFPRRPAAHPHLRRYSSHTDLLKDDIDPQLTELIFDRYAASEGLVVGASMASEDGTPVSRNMRKRQRRSTVARILVLVSDDVRNLYGITHPHRDAVSSGSAQTDAHRSAFSYTAEHAPAIFSILSRRIQASQAGSSVHLTPGEASRLKLRGYSADEVGRWLSCIQEPDSLTATAIFQPGRPTPPLFLVLLFLRRRRIRTFALGIVMRHLDSRRKGAPVPWESLKMLTVRLLRHARMEWPESIPWIASFFSAEAGRAVGQGRIERPKLIQDMTQFCNTLLWLLSLPSTLHPFRNSTHQENAQFQVLQFMQGCTPPLVVTRTGFRAVIRNQLMHPKTAQEREWAMLKGPSWPPWKESRNAMDEDKGYQFGASRASRVMHRMYEAGYEGHMWEQVAEVYAGWDTDLSPTIQTRSALPFLASRFRHDQKLQTLLWVARIQATRTRREAWACFLAWEASRSPIAAEPYAVMFEKLALPDIHRPDSSQRDEGESGRKRLMPGDAKEAFSEPESPLRLVHVDEPVPNLVQLLHRMKKSEVPISRRLLTFLVQKHPDLPDVIGLLKSDGHLFGSGTHKFLTGELLNESAECPLPEYFFGSLLSFLCRFGTFARLPPITPLEAAAPNHAVLFETNHHYRLEYAYALLMRLRPRYRPAWTAYMKAVAFDCPILEDPTLHHSGPALTQFTVLKSLFDAMAAIALDPDDAQFRILSICVRAAAHAARKHRAFPNPAAQHILHTAPRLLRAVFHALVAANIDPNLPDHRHHHPSLPPHVPDPPILHTYVRALAVLRDFEGLYSFSTWATANHAALTARAATQPSGAEALYRTFVALRAALEGRLDGGAERAPRDLVELVRVQLDGVPEWGWPSKAHVRLYLRNATQR